MKTYRATRLLGIGTRFTVEDGAGGVRHLRHVVFHSQPGMEFGYGGSGPADLALSILADVLNERPTRQQLNRGESLSWQLHQAFKNDYIAAAGRSGFAITEDAVWSWLAQHGVQRGKFPPTREALRESLDGEPPMV